MSARRVFEGIGVVAALAWAAALRLGWPGVHSFAHDEGVSAFLPYRWPVMGNL